MRWVFVGSGLIALGASTLMALNAAGGLSAPIAPGLIAMAFVLAVGAAAIGHAIARNHFAIAVVVATGMLAGEIGAMIQTAQRVTAAREAQRAPLVALERQRLSAEAELKAAEAATPGLISRSRIDEAVASQAAAARTIAEQAADKGCRENCRLLLQAAVDAAGREVEAARANLDKAESDQRQAIASRIQNARTAVAALPPPQHATPLAENSGIPEWVLDVLEAVALSLAINLPASALIALGAKMSARAVPQKALAAVVAHQALELPSIAIEGTAAPIVDKMLIAKVEAERFGIAMLRPARSSKLSPSEIRAAYLEWCRTAGQAPLPIREIAPAMGRMFRDAGIETVNGLAIGVAVREPAR